MIKHFKEAFFLKFQGLKFLVNFCFSLRFYEEIFFYQKHVLVLKQAVIML